MNNLIVEFYYTYLTCTHLKIYFKKFPFKILNAETTSKYVETIPP